jgi:hypothetical protein
MAKTAARPKARKAGRQKAAKLPARRATARKSTAKKAARKAPKRARVTARRAGRGSRAASRAPEIADLRGAEIRKDIGGVRLEVGRAGEGRVKRMIYPPGYKWSTDTKPYTGTDYCMHAHVGFLAQGRIDVVYPDGCVEVFEAPHIVAVAPGHDGHVVGSEPAVLIEFDFENDTVRRFGMPDGHRHD